MINKALSLTLVFIGFFQITIAQNLEVTYEVDSVLYSTKFHGADYVVFSARFGIKNNGVDSIRFCTAICSGCNDITFENEVFTLKDSGLSRTFFLDKTIAPISSYDFGYTRLFVPKNDIMTTISGKLKLKKKWLSPEEYSSMTESERKKFRIDTKFEFKLDRKFWWVIEKFNELKYREFFD